jgi:hypothetical protein
MKPAPGDSFTYGGYENIFPMTFEFVHSFGGIPGRDCEHHPVLSMDQIGHQSSVVRGLPGPLVGNYRHKED